MQISPRGGDGQRGRGRGTEREGEKERRSEPVAREIGMMGGGGAESERYKEKKKESTERLQDFDEIFVRQFLFFVVFAVEFDFVFAPVVHQNFNLCTKIELRKLMVPICNK